MRWTLLACALVGCNADPLVYQPITTAAYVFPNNRIPPELIDEWRLSPEENVEVAAVWAQQENTGAAPTVIFFHGQHGNIDTHWRKVMNIYEGGFNVLAVDYRGFGTSVGTPSEPGLYRDAEAAFDALIASGVAAASVVIWGYSLGTGVASHLALARPQAAGLLLEAPFTSLRAMIEQTSPYGPEAEWITTDVYPNLHRMPQLTLPLVVAHGTADARIPAWMGVKVYNAAPEPKRLVLVENGRHDNLLKHGREAIFAALGEVLQLR